MLTYLWTKDDKYYGLDGSVYTETPNPEEIVALQQYSRQFVNDSEGYRNAFNQNVAAVLGVPADESSFRTYYEGDSSCAINICEVTANVENNGGRPSVNSYAVKTDEGCYNIHFDFYNLNADCCDINLGHGVMYADNSSGFNMTSNSTGKDWVGICFSDKIEDLQDPAKYAWFHVNAGVDGLGVTSFMTYAFKRASSLASGDKPFGGTFESPAPTNDWSLSVQGNARYPIWMSTRNYYSDNRFTDWSTPTKMSDSKTFQSEWSDDSADAFYDQYLAGTKNLPDLNRFIDGNDEFEGIDEDGWRAAAIADNCGNWDDHGNGAKYLAWSNCRNGVWDEWSVSKIAGDDGVDGLNGGRTFMVFATMETEEEPATPVGGFYVVEENILTGVTPTYWSTDNNSSNGKYTWLSTGTFGPDGRQIGLWSKPIRITGEDGIDGTDGENREYIYKRFRDRASFDCYATDGGTDEESACYDLHQQFVANLQNYLDPGYVATDDAYQEPDFIPAGWEDHPEGVTETERIEACCVRVKEPVEGETDEEGKPKMAWGPFIGPFIWASWGEDGIDGDGVEYLFCITTRSDSYIDYSYLEPSAATEIMAVEEWEEYAVNELPEPTEDSVQYAYVTGATDPGYYIKKVVYVYPNDLLNPADILNEIETREGLEEIDRQILNAYYQKPDFIPGDKVFADIDDMDSALWEVAELIKGEGNVTTEYLHNICDWLDGNWTDNPLDVGPAQPFEWVTIRKYKKGTHDTTKEWQAFSEPKLWANWAYDGTSTFTSMVFCRTNDDISGMQLCGGTFDVPMPGAFKEDETQECTSDTETSVCVYDPVTKKTTVTYKDKEYVFEDTVPFDIGYKYTVISSDSLPSDTSVIVDVTSEETFNNPTSDDPEYIRYQNYYYHKDEQFNNSTIWMSMRIFGDDETNENQGWTSPRRMSDSTDFNVEWCLTDLTEEQIARVKSAEFNFGKYVDVAVDDDSMHTKAEDAWEAALFAADCGSWSDLGDGAIYMATTQCRNGKWTNWTVTKVKGEKGDSGTGIELIGYTKGIVMTRTRENNKRGLDSVTGMTVGDIWGVVCASQGDGCGDLQFSTYEFYKFEGYNEDTGKPIFTPYSCMDYWTYDPTTDTLFISASDSDKDTVAELPENVTESSKKFLHVIGTEEEPVNKYYTLVKKPFLKVGDTIIVNNIEPNKTYNQEYTADEIKAGCSGTGDGLENGDFVVWDGDSWRKTANLLGPGSYVHIKFADAVSLDGQYYRFTEPTETGGTHGEVPSKYMGSYVDEKKGDNEGILGNSYRPYNEGETPAATGNRYWSKDGEPYKWVKVVGDDGLGYEYIYCRTTGDTKSDTFDGGRPFTPVFIDEFYETEQYQDDDFCPTLTNVDEGYWASGSKCVDWTDNAVDCNTEYRFRWRCHRIKENGKWGPFIGDKSITTGSFPNGKYASFDANCSDELLIADFDNDFIAVYVDEDGNVMESVIHEATPILRRGMIDYIVDSVEQIGTLQNLTTARTQSGKVKITISEGFTVDSAGTSSIQFKITGHEDGSSVSREGIATVTILGIKSDTIYSLIPSMTTIKKNENGTGFLEPNLTCSVLKKVIGGETTEITYNNLAAHSSEFYIKYSYDDQSQQDFGGVIVFDNLSPKLKRVVVLNLYDKNDILNDSETIYVQSDGTSLFKADLDNENDAIPLTYEGLVEGSAGQTQTASTNVHLFCGSKELKINTIKVKEASQTDTDLIALTTTPQSIVGTNNNIKVSGERLSDDKGYRITVHVSSRYANFPEVFRLVVRVQGLSSEDENPHDATFSLSGVKAGSPGESAIIYNILTSDPSIIKKADGSMSPERIYAFIQKRTGSSSTIFDIAGDISQELNSSGMSICYSINNSDVWQNYIINSGVGTEDIRTNIRFRLVKSDADNGQNPIDEEKVPVVKDGEEGRGIIASCQYFKAFPSEDAGYVSANFNIPDYGPVDNDSGIAMIGTYMASQTSKEAVTAMGSIPATDDENKFIWMREQTWYTKGAPYQGPVLRQSKDGVSINGSQNYYISASTEATSQVKTIYDTIGALSGDSESLLAEIASHPEIINVQPSGDLEEGYMIWWFTVIFYSDNTCSVLPLGVQRDGSLIKDLQALKNMFGEANVDAKEGAFLREFLAVLDLNDPLSSEDDGAKVEVRNGNVKAFLNASPNWSRGDDKVMFASGIHNLGARNGISAISMSDFSAATVIWESGLIECENARIRGDISATTGYFGNYTSPTGTYVMADDSGLAIMTRGNAVLTINQNGYGNFYGNVDSDGNGSFKGTLYCGMGFTSNDGITGNGKFYAVEKSYVGNVNRPFTAQLTTTGIHYIENALVNGTSKANIEYEFNGNGIKVIKNNYDSSTGQLTGLSKKFEVNTNDWEFYFGCSDLTNIGYTKMQGGCVTASTRIVTPGTVFAAQGIYEDVYNTSDERLKNLGEPLKDVLKKINNIPTVYFNWKDKHDDKKHIGTTAQALLKVFPELVRYSEDKDEYSVAYDKLSIVALAAIKELSEEVEKLKAEIKSLKQQQ